MKPLFASLLILFMSNGLFAQNKGIGIGTTTPDTSAALDVTSSAKGILVPRMTSAQRTAIGAPAQGLLVYQTDGVVGFYVNRSTIPSITNWSLIGEGTNYWRVANNSANNITNTNTGNVGLQGNNTPASPLSFANTGGDKINLYQETTGQIYGLGIGTGTMQIYSPATRNIAFGTGSSAAFTQTMGLGATGSLFIQGADAGYIFKDRTDTTYGGWNWYANGGKANLFRYNSGGNLMTIDAAGNVGIGTTTPSSKLELKDNSVSPALSVTQNGSGFGGYFYSSSGNAVYGYNSSPTQPTAFFSGLNALAAMGKVGIGTTTPTSPLSFSQTGGDKINLYEEATNQQYGLGIGNGTLQIYTPNTGARNIAFGSGSSAAFTQSMNLGNTGSLLIEGANAGYIFKDRTDNTYGGWNWYANGGVASLYRYSSGGNLLSIDATGNMNLGATRNAVGYKLNVGGKIIAEEVRVNLQANWPDYVFAANYALKPLPELESFIKANNHLPNMPAAAEVEKSGIAIGEMQTKMMEKIEELSLYIIQQNKTIEVLKQQMEALQTKTGK